MHQPHQVHEAFFGAFQQSGDTMCAFKRQRKDAGRLTSVGAAPVMGVNKNQETQCTIFQGGLDAGA